MYNTTNATATFGASAVKAGQLAVRPYLAQDRILYLEKKFFCDRTTEKTVWLTVRDRFGYERTVSTKKVSCQFPILDIHDISSTDVENPKYGLELCIEWMLQNRIFSVNGWEVTQNFPTVEHVKLFNTPRVYNATVWARENEELTFRVRFGRGSHIRVTWNMTDPTPDSCKTMAPPGSFPTPST